METAAIAGMATGIQAARLQQEVATGVMKMQMDASKEAAQGIIDMMKMSSQALEKSVNPHLGTMLDILA